MKKLSKIEKLEWLKNFYKQQIIKLEEELKEIETKIEKEKVLIKKERK